MVPTERRRGIAATLPSFAAVVCFAAVSVLAPTGCSRDEAEAPGAPSGPGEAVGETSAVRPTNVLLITIDTLRADALGAYGDERGTSPNLDRLASQGVLFEQVVTSAPLTLPSHSTILTGKHPYAHGARSNAGFVLPEENVTLAEVLAEAGYVTAAEIAAPVIGKRTQLDQGFREYRGPGSFEVTLKRVGRATPDRVLLDDSPIELEERPASDITKFGLRFLREHADRPFFLWLHYFDPHTIYVAPPRFSEKFGDSPYHGEIAFVDEQVGVVIQQLRTLGIAERTLVVVTSDHGEALGEHDESTHSYFVYDSTMRVPLILWGPPDLPRGRRIGALVRTADIAPTILDLLDLPPLERIQGASLLPVVQSESMAPLRLGYGESLELRNTFGGDVLRFVREGRWKYIHKVRPELYDVLEDPGELDNLATERPERVEQLEGRLRDLIARAPARAGGAGVDVDAETWAQLQALGYAVTERGTEIEDELSSLELGGRDPVDMIEDVHVMARGWGLLKVEEAERAAETFQDLRERYPESEPVLLGLVNAMREVEGREEETAALLRVALEKDPDRTVMRRWLADILEKRADFGEAERELLVALERDPCAHVARSQLSVLLAGRERYGERLRLLEDGIEHCGENPSILNDYAWALATCPDPQYRDGQVALRKAKRAVEGEHASNPGFLDTLAAAYAETGDFARAEETSRQALALIQRREVAEEVMATFRDHLATIQAGEPIRAAQ